MYRKIIITLLVSAPLSVIIFFGYPIKSFNQVERNSLSFTKRCFKVGELGEMLSCYKEGKSLKGLNLIVDINNKLASLFPLGNILFFVFITLSFWQLYLLSDDST